MKRWGQKRDKGLEKAPISLRKQLSGMITFCCVVAVSIQAVVMILILVNHYVAQEREAILYLLENDNEKIDDAFQYLEEMVLSIQNDIGIRSFFDESIYHKDEIKEQLKSISNLYSDRNHVGTLSPFIENIYLFNSRGDTVCNVYYPVTLQEMEESQGYYERLYKNYKESRQTFYFEVNEKYLSLCMKLYDERMNIMGTCILALNKTGIEEVYANLEKLKYFNWSLRQEEDILLGEERIPYDTTGQVLEHEMGTWFGLKVHTQVAQWFIYRVVGMIAVTVLAVMVLVAGILSYIGHKLADYYVRPLETITEKIKLVGMGNFDTKLDEYRIEELQKISRTFNEMTNDIERLVTEVYETQLLAQQAQIRYLQAQMDPHFLYNILSMIRIKALINKDNEVQEMLHKLSGLYQGKIFRKEEHFIYLREEMEIIDFYLSLQKYRFEERINYKISYEEESEEYQNLLVPRLSIEPIVENAVCHGLEPKEGNGTIKVQVSKDSEGLKIKIEDDGVGFEAENITENTADKQHSHVGLWNTNKMIHNLCGKEYGLKIESKVGKGTVVNVLLPIKNEECYVEGNDC